MEKQKCNKCGRELPLTHKYWYKCSKKKSGFNTPCRRCFQNYFRKYKREKNGKQNGVVRGNKHTIKFLKGGGILVKSKNHTIQISL